MENWYELNNLAPQDFHVLSEFHWRNPVNRWPRYLDLRVTRPIISSPDQSWEADDVYEDRHKPERPEPEVIQDSYISLHRERLMWEVKGQVHEVVLWREVPQGEVGGLDGWDSGTFALGGTSDAPQVLGAHSYANYPAEEEQPTFMYPPANLIDYGGGPVGQ